MRDLPLLLTLSLLLIGCQPHTPDDYRREGERLMGALTRELRGIETREQLVEEQERLSTLFTQIAQLAVRAQDDLDRQTLSSQSVPPCNPELNQQLREQLIRIYKIEGGREIIEAAQQKAVIHLIHSNLNQ